MRTNDNLTVAAFFMSVLAIAIAIGMFARSLGIERELGELRVRVNTLIEVEAINQKSDTYLLMTLDNLVVITEELERRLHPAEEKR